MSDFEIFRSKQNRTHYVAILAGDDEPNARGVRESDNLLPFTRIPDDGKAHIALRSGSGQGGDRRARLLRLRRHGREARAH